jgi:hypothetical protein
MSLRNLLKSTVTIQELTTAVNAFKGSTKTFSNRTGLVNVRAGFKVVNGTQENESVEFDKRTERIMYRMYMEYSSAASAIQVTDRVILGSKTLEIRGTPYDPGGRNKLLQIECEAIE